MNDMSKRRHQTTISNARYSGIDGDAAFPFCLPLAKNEIQALWKKNKNKNRVVHSHRHTHSDTRHTENESIGTTTYLKCHFSENSINPKQVQTPMFIFTFIQCAIYSLPSWSLLVFEPVLKKKQNTHVHFTSTPQPALVWYLQNVKIIILHLRRKCVFFGSLFASFRYTHKWMSMEYRRQKCI